MQKTPIVKSMVRLLTILSSFCYVNTLFFEKVHLTTMTDMGDVASVIEPGRRLFPIRTLHFC